MEPLSILLILSIYSKRKNFDTYNQDRSTQLVEKKRMIFKKNIFCSKN